MSSNADIGLIGLAVMGQNLVMNMNDHGFKVAVYNRTRSKVDEFLSGAAAGSDVEGAASIRELIAKLKRPRRLMLMVKAGEAVENTVADALTYLEKGDVLINGGNENYNDSIKMARYLEPKGILYVGCGVSGGEEGARLGPSMMPGGSKEAWPLVKDIFQAIAAKAPDGSPCCDWIGPDGAGHFVKMVHNGIEYGDMQLICEAYDLMKNLLKMTPKEMSVVFKKWNDGALNSYLIEITGDILAYTDENGDAVVEKILDTAGQKGTGKWTSVSAMDSGVPLTMIIEATLSRFLSALKDERQAASSQLSGPDIDFKGDRGIFIDYIKDALYAAKIVSYTQGYMLCRAVSDQFQWNLNYGAIALIWREGCIIRAAFLDKIKDAFAKNPSLGNLMLDPYFKSRMRRAQEGWRQVVSTGIESGIALPALTSALTFYDGYRRQRLPANLLQAQRDYFGAHTYERIDKERGEFFHTNWTGRGGAVTSASYNV